MNLLHCKICEFETEDAKTMKDHIGTHFHSEIERMVKCMFEVPKGICVVEDSYNHRLNDGDCKKCECYHACNKKR